MTSTWSQYKSLHISVISAVVTLTLLAWAYLVHVNHQMATVINDADAMRAMGMSVDTPWTPADVGYAFVMWTVMMAGMMAPSATPVLLVVARSSATRGASRLTTIVFALGYFAVWTGFSAVATVVQWLLHNSALLSPAMAAVSPRVGGIVLVIAGLYELTPEKRACLVHCRNPIDFLMTFWRPGTSGALRIGFQHGLFCLGCCWALMMVLFGVGVMNLLWVAIISVIVLVEKAGWGGLVLSRAAGVGLLMLGAYLAL